MKCKCTDAFCLDAKKRIDICRSAVLRATHNETRVSCSVAQWICMADPLCSTALDYYHSLCRSMFAGKKCTHRCNNSISILRRQVLELNSWFNFVFTGRNNCRLLDCNSWHGKVANFHMTTCISKFIIVTEILNFELKTGHLQNQFHYIGTWILNFELATVHLRNQVHSQGQHS